MELENMIITFGLSFSVVALSGTMYYGRRVENTLNKISKDIDKLYRGLFGESALQRLYLQRIEGR